MILSRFVALSFLLIQKVSPFQNQEAQFYAVFGSNHPAQASSYWAPIVDWLPHAREEAAEITSRLNLTRPQCANALHFS